MEPRLLIAAGVVGIIVVIFALGFGFDAYEQMKQGHYTMPKDIMDVLKLVLSASVACLGIGSLVEKRKKKKDVE